MKRRQFIATTGAVGIASVVSGTSVASSAFDSISSREALKEFTPETKGGLDKFATEVAQNIQDQGLDQKYANLITAPVRIISKNQKNGTQSIVYKNKAKEFVSLTVSKKETRIKISKSL